MKTIALRFSDSFAPEDGTIAEHKKMIKENGFVWYGKLGPAISEKVRKDILENKTPKILLVHSGKSYRYWAYVDQIIRECPPIKEIPVYYRDQAGLFHTWFRVTNIKEAEKGIMSMCKVTSSGAPLSTTSRKSMSPYFIIELPEGSLDENS